VSLLVTGGLMKLSFLVLGGDTGALHLAVAMGGEACEQAFKNLRGANLLEIKTGSGENY
jgi:hypothetical protein